MILPFIVLLIAILYGPHLWARYVLNKYNKVEYFSGNGMTLARLILDKMEMSHVPVEVSDVGDHYDPEEKAVRLSNRTCGKKTLTAVVVAAHEVGHAIQDHHHFGPLKARTRLVRTAAKIEKMGAALMIAVPVIALVTRMPSIGLLLFWGGLATLSVPLVVHLLTLPTEFDASFNRALPILSSGKFIPPEDLPAARKILMACALTYVAVALTGFLNIWRWIRILRF
jgi:Zn-dependent membrane protease YugP